MNKDRSLAQNIGNQFDNLVSNCVNLNDKSIDNDAQEKKLLIGSLG